ncbi:MAG: chromate transporter [Clostridia bacterium]|nr:chromate transporter [Clostridia bacterium]
MKKQKRLTELFLTFFKIGLFTFGGGYAMIGVIENTCVEKKKWLTHDQMANIAVIAESTPGPIAINSATYVGNTIGGFWGAVCATLGVVLPSFVIIFIISLGLDKVLEYPIVANAFKGIKVGVSLLILDAGINMALKSKSSVLTKIILFLSCIAMLVISIFSVNISSIVLMLIAGTVGLTVYHAKKHRRDKK